MTTVTNESIDSSESSSEDVEDVPEKESDPSKVDFSFLKTGKRCVQAGAEHCSSWFVLHHTVLYCTILYFTLQKV